MTFDQIHQMVVAANPVPDPELLEPIDMPDLTAARRGSSDMARPQITRDDHRATSTRPATPGGAPRWRRPAIGAALIGVAIIVVATLVITRGGDPVGPVADGSERKVPVADIQLPTILEDYVDALRRNDAEAATALLTSDAATGLTPWLVGLDSSGVEFTDCVVIADTGGVSCTTTFGPSFFYSRIGGQTTEFAFSAWVGDETLNILSWTGPFRDPDFRDWVQNVHPERYDEMFCDPTREVREGCYLGDRVLLSEASGAARTELADEYLASRR